MLVGWLFLPYGARGLAAETKLQVQETQKR